VAPFEQRKTAHGRSPVIGDWYRLARCTRSPAILATEPLAQTQVEQGLSFDVLIREAFPAGVPLIDLHRMCNTHAQDANALAPSSIGGAKSAAVMARAVREHECTRCPVMSSRYVVSPIA
jgi:hypothetical protein